jgi:transcriptional regulator with XRE-family HTH domain
MELKAHTSQLLRNIARWRIYCGKSQEQIADILGISDQQYQKIESGRSPLSMERFFKIAIFLKIDPIKLMTLHLFEGDSIFSPPQS